MRRTPPPPFQVTSTFTVVALLCAFVGPAFGQEPGADPLHLPDAYTTPQLRIITLAPNLTETVFALGRGADVVAVTDYCHFPPRVAVLPRVGGLYDPNIERMIALRPDVVFHVPHHAALAQRLRNAGIRTVNVPSETVDDIYEGILIIGEALGEVPRAENLVKAIRARIDEITAQVKSLPRQRVLIAVDHEPGSVRGLFAAGSGNYLDELVRMAGGDNILRDTATTYPKISPEVILQSPPDVILDTKYADWGIQGREWEGEMRRAWLALFPQGMHPPRVEFVTQPRVNIPGPSIVVGLRVLARYIHGDAFNLTPSPDADTQAQSTNP